MLMLASLAACDDSETRRQESDTHLRKGVELARQGDLAKARVELQIASAGQPKNAEIDYDLGGVEEQQGDIKAAFADYERAAVPAAHHLKAQLRVAEMLADAGETAGALRRINVTLAVMPDSAEARGLRADIEERLGMSGPAQADADATLKADPANVSAIAVQADIALKGHDAVGALSILDRYAIAGPRDVRLLREQAAAFAALRRWDEAIAVDELVVAGRPRNPQSRLALSALQEDAGRQADAEKTLREGVRLAPDDRDLAFALVGFVMKHHGRDAAENAVKDLIAAKPDDGLYDIALAMMLDEDGKPKAAIESLTVAMARLGSSPPGLKVKAALARLWAQAGEGERAVALLDSVIAVDPVNNDALVTRAALRTMAGHGDQAIADLTAVVGREPTDVAALEALSVAYRRNGDTVHAIEAMRRAADTSPEEAAPHLQLAILLQGAGQAQAAREVLDDVTRSQPNLAKAWVTGAQLAMGRKDWDSATVALGHLQTLAPASSDTWRIQGQLALAQGHGEVAVVTFARLVTAPGTPDLADLVTYAQASIGAKQAGPTADLLLQRADTLHGDAAQTCYLLVAGLRIVSGQMDKADAAFALGVAMTPARAEPYITYGQQLIDGHHAERALQIVAQGLRANAPREPLLLVQAAAETAENQTEAALTTYRAVLSSNPNSMVAANNYAALLSDFVPRDTVRLAEARRYLAPAATSANPALLDSLAWLDFRLGDFDAAKVLLERAHAGPQSDPAIKRHYDLVLAAMGNPDTRFKGVPETGVRQSMSGALPTAALVQRE
ncbi:MAG: tetratricopeptide repeat protein [Azospirillaceae bacterium]|nr:tetratricopeptide repeat protein [Azospirillaceae bacterium]